MSELWIAEPRRAVRWVVYARDAYSHAVRAGSIHLACGRVQLDDRFVRPDLTRPHCAGCEAGLMGSDSPAGAGESQEAFRG